MKYCSLRSGVKEGARAGGGGRKGRERLQQRSSLLDIPGREI